MPLPFISYVVISHNLSVVWWSKRIKDKETAIYTQLKFRFFLKFIVGAAFRGILLYLCGGGQNALFLCARYPHTESWVSGKGITLALAGSAIAKIE